MMRALGLVNLWSLRPLLVAVVVVGLGSRPALAQTTSEGASPLAEALFREGVRLLDAGRVPEACSKFAESQKLDPGLGTLLNLAACHEKDGRYASAWAEYAEAAALAGRRGDRQRERYARARGAKLEGVIHRYVLRYAGTASGLEVIVDDQSVGPGLIGTPIPLDAGEHRITVRAPGRVPWSVVVHAENGGRTDTIDVPELAPAAELAPVAERASAIDRSEARATGSTAPSSASRVLAYVGLGLGVVSVGAAGYFGWRMLDLDRSSTDACPPSDPCAGDAYARARGQYDDAKTFRTYALVAGGVGIAALGAGTLLLLTRSSRTPSSVALAPAPFGAVVRGAW